jgi:transglutaminase-like putative cysteine protease
MRYHVRHATSYRYGSDVLHAHHLLHLVPRPAAYQLCLEHEVRITPVGYRLVDGIDSFGNPLSRIEITQPHRDLTVTSDMLIEVHARPAVSAGTTWPWEQVRDAFAYRGQWPAREALEAAHFRHESPHVRVKKMFTAYCDECFPVQRPLLECAEALSAKLHRELQYAPGETTIGTPVTTVLRDKRGVCQDFALCQRLSAHRRSGVW